MKTITCASARRKLQAYHDRELPVGDEIAVASHLEWCSGCAETFSELQLVSAALREIASGRQPLSREESAGFTAAVVGRMDAEHDQSLLVRVRDMFDDMHLVYAGLGATAATLVCIVIMLGMMRFATSERPDSLAAIVNILANPGSNANPVAIDARVQMPRALDGALSSSPAQEDAVFALAAVVTREGTIANLEMLRTLGRPDASDAKAADALMDAMSRARFEPAQLAGLPVAVNMVWVIAHTTVRGKHPIA
jgi:hypothetical protein